MYVYIYRQIRRIKQTSSHPSFMVSSVVLYAFWDNINILHRVLGLKGSTKSYSCRLLGMGLHVLLHAVTVNGASICSILSCPKDGLEHKHFCNMLLYWGMRKRTASETEGLTGHWPRVRPNHSHCYAITILARLAYLSLLLAPGTYCIVTPRVLLLLPIVVHLLLKLK